MSFLFNMFSRNNREQLSKYDRISFKINLSDHIPQYYESTSNKAITEAEITPDHPLYYEIFPKTQQPGHKQQSNDFVDYVAKSTDTMFGIALRLDLSQQYLRSINSISGSLYPGMVIKLPKEVDLTKLEQESVSQQTERLRISQLLNSDKPTSTDNYKYIVNYLAGPSGQIKGSLTINPNYIIFNPLLQDPDNLSRFTIQKLLKFNVLVEMADIQKAEYLHMPGMSSQIQPKFNNIVQFMLYKVGNLKIEKKYKDRLKELKINNKAIASISFSFLSSLNQGKDNTIEKDCQQITNNINQIIKNQVPDQDEDNKKRLTNIPFFDIIHDKTDQKDKGSNKQIQTHILSTDSYLGTLTEDSDVLTPAHFQNLVKKFPILYRLYNWQKVFSARRDGSAFNTFLSKTKDVEPAIILIKEYKGNLMGAFLIESIQFGKTGRGEMFIFTFRGDSKDPQVYTWTTKNDFFVYLDKEQGLGIGMGIKYGLFMNRNLQKGSSAATKTFGNTQPLSVNQDFHIDEVEVWGVDNSF